MRRLALAALVACGGAARPPERSAPPANDCDRVADHLLSLMSATAREAPAEKLDRMRRLFAERCEQDRWSSRAQACLLGVAALAEVPSCEETLTQAQADALGAAIMAEAEQSAPSE